MSTPDIVIHTAPAAATAMPLVVDLDGTLIHTDLLVEAVFARLGKNPFSVFQIACLLLSGKAKLKEALASAVPIDAATLPYDREVLAKIHAAVAAGRPVYLASASNERYVAAVAKHLKLFTGWFASDGTTNLSGPRKAQKLVDAFGLKGFDYIGNDKIDLAIWQVANHSIAIRTTAYVRNQLVKLSPNAEHLPHTKPTLKTWVKLLRVHQYAKNILVFVPLFTAQKFEAHAVREAVLAMIAFSLCASSVYLLNDLVDLASDRAHPTKRKRPFASGAMPLSIGIVGIPILFIASMAVAALISLPFFGVLMFYFFLTTAYTFFLKRKMIIDVIALAGLYTIRMVGGAVAINVAVSEWLFGFSMFMFLTLALIKRYTELATRLDASLPDPSNRNYKISDLDIVAALAAAAGFNSITVYALYISSDTVHKLYRHPHYLWLTCPVLMYWISRALMLAHRRLMDDDPIVFALKDWNSLVAAACIGAAMLAAI